MNKRLLFLMVLCISISAFAQGTEYYVKVGGTGTGTGGWGNAMGNDAFCLALYNATSGDIFYVAAGTYHPTRNSSGSVPSNLNSATFIIKTGVTIVGSYKTTLTGTAKNWNTDRILVNGTGELAPTTIFSGDLDGNGTLTSSDISTLMLVDNPPEQDQLVTLNGIEMTKAYRSGITSRGTDIEMDYCKVTGIRGEYGNFIGAGAQGGIIDIERGGLSIRYSAITDNTHVGGSDSNYGMIKVNRAPLHIYNSVISGNTAASNCASVIYFHGEEYNANNRKNIIIYNSTISNNTTSSTTHGAILIESRSAGIVDIINSTIVDNTSGTSTTVAGIVVRSVDWGGWDEIEHIGPTRFNLDNTILAGNTSNNIVMTRNTNSGPGAPTYVVSAANEGLRSYVPTVEIGIMPSNSIAFSIIGSMLCNGNAAYNSGFLTSSHLSALAYNGGLTKTRAISSGSGNPVTTGGNPAYNGSGSAYDGLNRDQRGFLRLDGEVSIGAFQYAGIDDSGSGNVSLNLTVFLQGVTQSNGTMTNYIQVPGSSLFSQPRLPATDPYSGNTTFSGINNVGAAGAVVDWIQVEIWSVNMGTYSRTILDEKALLLRPNGTIVDTDGNAPKFQPQTGAVRIVIKHRNHLGVMSNEISSFTGSITYDFSSAVSQSVTGYGNPMVNVGGKWALWAGDVNVDGTIDPLDFSEVNTVFGLGSEDGYLKTDLNMDGAVDPLDFATINTVFNMGIESILFDFE